jgi:hypothetical protein
MLNSWSEFTEVEGCDSARLRHLLKRKLAWYGLGAVKVSWLRFRSNRALFVELRHADGAVQCQIEIDRLSDTIRTSRAAFRRPADSLPTTRTREVDVAVSELPRCGTFPPEWPLGLGLGKWRAASTLQS